MAAMAHGGKTIRRGSIGDMPRDRSEPASGLPAQSGRASVDMVAVLPADAVQVDSRAGWRRWLSANHSRSTGIWLVTWRKDSGRSHLPYDAVVEEALCFGWIDSKPRKLDAARTMLWIAPRKPGSGWSRANKQRIERLLAAGRIAPPGLARIEAARRDGSWSKLDAVEDLVVPEDLAVALAALPPAAARFAEFPRSVRRGILEWIGNAKRAETRSARVRETAVLAARGERANQWRPRAVRT